MAGRKVVLDTNFLMVPEQVGVDIFEELRKTCDFQYELYTTSANIDELERIVKTGNLRDRTAAKVALGLAKAKNLKIVPVERNISADDFLCRLSTEGYLIATADRGLQKRLKSYIYLRQKKYIAIKGAE
jgi:rRNA-processing protein FCF1